MAACLFCEYGAFWLSPWRFPLALTTNRVWSEQTVAHISGKASQGLSPEESRRQMLARAARATVDHGYRYFALMNASPSAPTLQPGADLVIHMLSAKESGRKGALDAYRLLEARTTAR